MFLFVVDCSVLCYLEMGECLLKAVIQGQRIQTFDNSLLYCQIAFSFNWAD